MNFVTQLNQFYYILCINSITAAGAEEQELENEISIICPPRTEEQSISHKFIHARTLCLTLSR